MMLPILRRLERARQGGIVGPWPRCLCCSVGGVNATASDAPAKAATAAVSAPTPAPPAPTTTWGSIVIGEIVQIHQHPEADRLNVCQVNVGDPEAPLQIICGAPNARQGARVPVAKIGTRLAIKDAASGDVKLLKIKKSKLRGELSQGMICSEAELGLAAESTGILILDDNAPIGALAQDWPAIASRLVSDDVGTGVEAALPSTKAEE